MLYAAGLGPRVVQPFSTPTVADVFATVTGLEPATSSVTGMRANQLRYTAKLI